MISRSLVVCKSRGTGSLTVGDGEVGGVIGEDVTADGSGEVLGCAVGVDLTISGGRDGRGGSRGL